MANRSKEETTYALRWAKKIRATEMLGGKCSNCGEENIFVLDFHHVNGKKENKISQMLGGARWDAIKEEISKCILLCRNCHMATHYRGGNEIKNKLLQLKGEDRCSRCGYYGSSASLDFHHIGKKDFRMGVSHNGHSFILPVEDILAEIDKCEVLCRNCHALVHSDIERFESAKQYIYFKVKNHECQPLSKKEQIIEMLEEGKKQIDIAREFQCAKSTVCRIAKLYVDI
jgi:hypothetical protein